MESLSFAFVCEALEELTGMSRLQTRGTIRLLLRGAGLEPDSVTRGQLLVVIDRMLPEALHSRGVGDAAQVCHRLKELLVTAEAFDRPSLQWTEETPDGVDRKGPPRPEG